MRARVRCRHCWPGDAAGEERGWSHRLGQERHQGLHARQDQGARAARRVARRAEGEFLSIAGPSGSGKTTLLNLIGCVDTPTAGTVEVAGKDTTSLSERALTALRLHHSASSSRASTWCRCSACSRTWSSRCCCRASSTAGQRQSRVTELLERVGLRARQPPPQRALRRPAPARRHRPRPGDPPGAGAGRRAHRQPRLGHRQEHHRPDEGAEPRDGTTFIFSTHDAKVMAHASAVVRSTDGRIASPRGGGGAGGGGGHDDARDLRLPRRAAPDRLPQSVRQPRQDRHRRRHHPVRRGPGGGGDLAAWTASTRA